MARIVGLSGNASEFYPPLPPGTKREIVARFKGGALIIDGIGNCEIASCSSRALRPFLAILNLLIAR